MLKNKRGDGYIQACVMILLLCMLIAVCLTFVTTVNTIRVVERNARIVLDSFVMENSIIIYDSIKNGHDFTEAVDVSQFRIKLADYNDLTKSGAYYYHYDPDGDGDLDYCITTPVLSMTQTNSLKIAADYTITIPLYFAGMHISTVSVPITVESRLTNKF